MQHLSQGSWYACQLLAIVAGVSLALAGAAVSQGGVGGAAGGAAGAAGSAAGAAAGAAGAAAGGLGDAASGVGNAAGNAAGSVGSAASGAVGAVGNAASSATGAVGNAASNATGTVGSAVGGLGNLGSALGLDSLGMGSVGGAKPGTKAHKAYKKKILAVFEAEGGAEQKRIKRQCVDVLRHPAEYDLSLVDLCRVLRMSQRR